MCFLLHIASPSLHIGDRHHLADRQSEEPHICVRISYARLLEICCHANRYRRCWMLRENEKNNNNHQSQHKIVPFAIDASHSIRFYQRAHSRTVSCGLLGWADYINNCAPTPTVYVYTVREITNTLWFLSRLIIYGLFCTAECFEKRQTVADDATRLHTANAKRTLDACGSSHDGQYALAGLGTWWIFLLLRPVSNMLRLRLCLALSYTSAIMVHCQAATFTDLLDGCRVCE